ncbi:DUF938 domain-containing protein [Croceicoccus sp. Ery5]|uniref:DUF938 domain-containing protein n=1 Tax=Croceicoccus sp. Ery5 TaxID=1703340 RepID=UPI00351D512A
MSAAGSDRPDRGHDPADRWVDDRRHAPATQRNREPIGDCLATILPATGLVLEVASGSGEHALFFARRFPALEWQPSDPDADAIRSIAAWRGAEGTANLRAPVMLDASAPDWPVDRADAMLCVNMVHISPWDATIGLFAGAARVLPAGAPLVIYGPFRSADIPTAPSNLEFDRSLKMRDPRWGLRDLADVDALAQASGLMPAARHGMPAHNMLLEFRRI